MQYALTPLKAVRPLVGDELACMIAVRNERLRLPDLIRHYRELGVGRFLVVDNGSIDGTRELLSSEYDVDLWFTEQPFSEARSGNIWYNKLSEIYGRNRWYLIVDADELIVYPDMASVSLPTFCKKLSARSIPAIRAPMIDMYSQHGVFNTDFVPGGKLIDQYPFFDGAGYAYRRTKSGGLVLTGGARARIISQSGTHFQNVLEKYPLRYWRSGQEFFNIHIHPEIGLESKPYAALLHFKLLPDFREKIDDAIRNGQHWKNSFEYVSYKNNIDALSSPFNAKSIRYDGPETLCRLKLMFRIE